jgi:hypothetical protein
MQNPLEAFIEPILYSGLTILMIFIKKVTMNKHEIYTIKYVHQQSKIVFNRKVEMRLILP